MAPVVLGDVAGAFQSSGASLAIPPAGTMGPSRRLFGQKPPSGLVGTAPLRNCRWPIPHCHSVLALKWRCVGPKEGLLQTRVSPHLLLMPLNQLLPNSSPIWAQTVILQARQGCPTHMLQKNNLPNLIHPTTKREHYSCIRNCWGWLGRITRSPRGRSLVLAQSQPAQHTHRDRNWPK